MWNKIENFKKNLFFKNVYLVLIARSSIKDPLSYPLFDNSMNKFQITFVCSSSIWSGFY